MAMYANVGGANKLLAQTSAEAGGGVVSVILTEDNSSHSIQGNTILFSCAGNYSYGDIQYSSCYLTPFMGIYDIATGILEGINTQYRREGDSSAIGYVSGNDIYMVHYKNESGTSKMLSISNGVVTSYADQMHFTYIILA